MGWVGRVARMMHGAGYPVTLKEGSYLDQDLVYHRCIQGLRAGIGGSRPGARGQRRRDGLQARDPGRARRRVWWGRAAGQLDVTDRGADFDAVKRAADQRAADHFGRLDVVINNAGYGHFGMIEELTEDEVRSQLETNLFGALWVTQAALPIMRAQGSGHIIQVSSIGGISAFPTVGAYHASKWALEGFSQSLAREVAGFGINVTLIDPGGYATDWSGPSATRSEKNPAYADVREAAKNRPSASDPAATRRRPGGDPAATRAAILKVVDADEPPPRIFFGKMPLEIATRDYESRPETWNEWQSVSVEAHGA